MEISEELIKKVNKEFWEKYSHSGYYAGFVDALKSVGFSEEQSKRATSCNIENK
jgi:hypothetical protein